MRGVLQSGRLHDQSMLAQHDLVTGCEPDPIATPAIDARHCAFRFEEQARGVLEHPARIRQIAEVPAADAEPKFRRDCQRLPGGRARNDAQSRLPDSRPRTRRIRRDKNDWDELLCSLAKLYVHGSPVNWEAVNRPYSGRRLSLPTYPFERQSYWLPSPQAGTSWQQPIPPSANPLLGRRLPTATPIFETVLKPDTPLYLSEHQICGATLVAASVFFEMAQACARETFGESKRVRVRVRNACGFWIPPEESWFEITAMPANGQGISGRATGSFQTPIGPNSSNVETFIEVDCPGDVRGGCKYYVEPK